MQTKYDDKWSRYERSGIGDETPLEYLAMTIEEYQTIVSEIARPITDTPLGVR